MPRGSPETLILNEGATSEVEREMLIWMGTFFGFSFLTGQSFGVELADAVWK